MQLEEMVQKMDLIDLRYVVPLIEAGGVMPRWQDLPKSARITVHNLWRLNTMVHFGVPLLAVLVLSYPWRASPRKSRTHATSRRNAPLTHPKCPARRTVDREHPDRLGEQLRALLPFFKLALAELKEHPHHTFGLMMDYGCLPQKPFASDEEKQRFKRGLQNINKYAPPARTRAFLARLAPLLCCSRLLAPPPLSDAGGTSTPACSRSA